MIEFFVNHFVDDFGDFTGFIDYKSGADRADVGLSKSCFFTPNSIRLLDFLLRIGYE